MGALSSWLSQRMPKERPTGLDSAWVPQLVKFMSRANVRVYQLSGGRLWTRWFLYGLPIALLTTRGRKSGQLRTTPLLFMPDGDRFIVVASQGGLPRNPAWYHNVKAEPRVRFRVRRREYDLRARVVDEAERAELWPRLVAMYPDFATYQSWTERTIPVVALEPGSGTRVSARE